MPEKLLTLSELSEYIGLKEDEIRRLVDEGILPAYVIGGSYLRFRKEQIDAVKNEIKEIPRPPERPAGVKKETGQSHDKAEIESIGDRIHDFFYFSDFYIICGGIVALLLYVIFKM